MSTVSKQPTAKFHQNKTNARVSSGLAKSRPTLSGPSSLLHWQRTVGNQAVQRLLRNDTAKSNIRLDGSAAFQSADTRKSSSTLAVQKKQATNRPEGVHKEDANTIRAAAEHGVSGDGGPLPHRGAIQRSFGRHDVSAVRAHVGGIATRAARAIGAAAYAIGNAVAFSELPDLSTAAHEAAHVVQQRAGVKLSDGIGRQGDVYEQQADAIAARVVQGRSAEPLLDRCAGSGEKGRSVQRFAFVSGKQITATAKGYTSEMDKMLSDTVVRDYSNLAEFVNHSAKGTDYLGNLANGTWLRFEPAGTNLLGEDHTYVPLDKVLPMVGSKSFIYEPFSSDVLKPGSATETAYETENKDLFKTFGIEKEKTKQPFGAESLFPKIGFALTLAMPYFDGKKKMIDIDPSGYVGQPVQRYLKIAWGHSKDNFQDVQVMQKAKQKIPPKMYALALVHATVESKIDKFITSLKVDDHIEKELDKPANAALLPLIASFAKAFTELVVEMAATSPTSRLSPAERKKLAAAPTTSDADKFKLFSEWRDFGFEDSVKGATKRGVRYAGMGLNHLKHLLALGLEAKQHPYDMTPTGKEMKEFIASTDKLKKAAVPVAPAKKP